jgi:hypothetical protein
MTENCFKKIYVHGDFQDFRLDYRICQRMKEDLEKGNFKQEYILPFKHYF